MLNDQVHCILVDNNFSRFVSVMISVMALVKELSSFTVANCTVNLI